MRRGRQGCQRVSMDGGLATKETVMDIKVGATNLQTRAGDDVRVYATDGAGSYPVHGAYYSEYDEGWCALTCTLDGAHHIGDTPAPLDFIEKPESNSE